MVFSKKSLDKITLILVTSFQINAFLGPFL